MTSCRSRCSANILVFALAAACALDAEAQSLATFEHHVVGARIGVTPEDLYVPKSIPGSLMVQFATADGSPHPDALRLGRGLHVEAVLRGPAFPAYRLLGLPGEPLMLPPIALVGEYQIDDIRLVDTASGETRAMGVPSTVPVHVFAEVLVSQVESRPLTLDEITARGIVIDAESFSAVEFTATLTLAGRPFPVSLPVVTPKFNDANELMSIHEREELIVEAERVNALLAESLEIPSDARVPGLDLFIKGINFEEVSDGGGDDDRRSAGATIPGLVVIPGSVGFLDQFFSVQVFTANAAPMASRITVHSLEAELVMPTGLDRVAGSADDPLRVARVGPQAIVQSRLPIHGLGGDGVAGTPDDLVRLQPGQTGQAEFLVEGRREGLHTFDILLRGTLDGFAHREVRVEGRAAGSVLVRNPRFSVVFSHPRTVRTGQGYSISVTVMNTSETPAHFVSVNLNRASVVGADFAEGQDEMVPLGTLGPGETATASYDLVAYSTGQVRLAQLTGGDGLSGRVDLTVAVDELGVELSPNVIGYPEWVSLLPEDVRIAADRVLGQALASATAAILPPGVRRVEMETVRQRVIELTEAAQRLGHGDIPARTYLDLLLDWHGGRTRSLGFDQILRETEAGAALRTAILASLETTANGATGRPWIDARQSDVAGRSERWAFAAASEPGTQITVQGDAGTTSSSERSLPETSHLRGVGGAAVLIREPSRPGLEVVFRLPVNAPSDTVTWTVVGDDGHGVRRSWTLTSRADQPVCYRLLTEQSSAVLVIDEGCAEASSGQLGGSSDGFEELAPEIIRVHQDLSVLVERPMYHCHGARFDYFGESRFYENYGTLALILFSKPMSGEALERAGALQLATHGVGTTGVKLQPGGRVALANFRQAFGTLEHNPARSLEVAPFVTDRRGHPVATRVHAIQAVADDGVAVNGRVLGNNGEPLANIPVTLTMHDTTVRCIPHNVRASQVMTDADGRFRFDFVMAGLPFSVSATDIRGLSAAAAAVLREASPTGEFDADEVARLTREDGTREIWAAEGRTGDANGAILLAESVDRTVVRDYVPLDGARMRTEVPMVLRFRGRGVVSGTVFAPGGVLPVAGAAVNLYPEAGSRELGRGVFSDAQGRFEFVGVPVGELSVQVATSNGMSRTVAERLDDVGQHLELAIELVVEASPRGTVQGTVYESDGVTGHPRAELAFLDGHGTVLSRTQADTQGQYRATGVPAAASRVVAISADGRRAADRAVVLSPNAVVNAHLVLPGWGVVSGRVELPNGDPVPFARVAGGQTIVDADEDGVFTTTVPSGLQRTIAAGIAVPGAPVRIGSARVDVLPGLTSYVVVRFTPAGQISGCVTNEVGVNVPYVRVAIPQPPNGYYWTDSNANGCFSFAPLALGRYSVTAPAPALRPDNTEALVAAAQDAILSGAYDELESAMGQLFARLTSIRPGTPERPPPPHLGGTVANLLEDGDNAISNIVYLRRGTVEGTVRNPLQVPIAASVQLSALTLDKVGTLLAKPIAFATSDPITGAYRFDGVPVGPYTVVATSTFYPGQRPSRSGVTTLAAASVDDVNLAFLPVATTGGRLSGRVLDAGAGVEIQIDGPLYQIETVEDGLFDTVADISFGQHRLSLFDPATGRYGYHEIWIDAGEDRVVELSLLSMDGGLEVTVTDGTGEPVVGAALEIIRVGLPSWPTITAATGAGGVYARPTNTMEGRYGVTACYGTIRLCVSGMATVADEGVTSLALQLSARGTIRGTYVEGDGATPVPFAQVVASADGIGELAVAVTDAAGGFEIEGLPLRTIGLLARNVVSGRAARGEAEIVTAGQVVQVVLREDLLGRVVGGVVATSGSGFAPGATVTLAPSSALFAPRTVTADPGGQFTFPGVPPGPFSMTASHGGHSGSVQTTMPSTVPELQVDVPLARLATVTVDVVGLGGAPEVAYVQLSSTLFQDTTTSGRAVISNVPLGTYSVLARSRVVGQTHSEARGTLVVGDDPAGAAITLRLSGVGSVTGEVRDANGVLVSGAEVLLDEVGLPRVAVTAADGRFTFADVALGEVRVRAREGGRGGLASGVLDGAGDTVELDIDLTPSGDVIGRLVRADGVTAIANADVMLGYDAVSGLAGSARMRTDAQGAFQFLSVPYGPLVLRTQVPRFDGALAYRPVGGLSQAFLDLGVVRLDEVRPTILTTSPVDSAINVTVGTSVEINFSEPMDTTFADEAAVYLVDADSHVVPASLSWPTPTRLVLDPDADLASTEHYSLVVLGPAQASLYGSYAGPGPRDQADRPLAAPFTMRFTTVDNVPPEILTFTPEDGAERCDASTVIRLTFSEPIDAASLEFELYDETTEAVVPVSVATALDDRLLVLTPIDFLQPNRVYTATLTQVRDRAGVGAVDEGSPIVHEFATEDTEGPVVTALTFGESTATLVTGAIVTFEATVAPEPGLSIEASQDLQPIVWSAPNTTVFTLTIGPPNPAMVVRARAVDRFGNRGPWHEETYSVVANTPPQVALSRLPATGPLLTGRPYALRAEAYDDSRVARIFGRIEINGVLWEQRSLVGASALEFSGQVLDADLGPGVSLTFIGEATDNAGITTIATPLTIPLADGAAPQVTLSDGPTQAAAGSTVELQLDAIDAFGVTEVEVSVTGPALGTGGGVLSPVVTEFHETLEIEVDPDADPSSVIEVVANAFDAAGNVGTTIWSITVADVTPPVVSSVTPAHGAVNASVTGGVTVEFSEAVFGVNATRFRLLTAGNVVPASVSTGPNHLSATLMPATPMSPLTEYTAQILAGITDQANLPLAPVSVTFTTADVDAIPPRLVAIRPANGSVGAAIPLEIEFEFDEPIDFDQLPSNAFTLVRESDGEPLETDLDVWGAEGRVVRYNAGYQNRGDLGTSYVATLTAAPRDFAGNEAVGLTGAPWSPATSTFTTATIELDVETDGYASPDGFVVAGFGAVVFARAHGDVEMWGADFTVGGQYAGSDYQSLPRRSINVPAVGPPTFEVEATAQTTAGAFPLAPITLTVVAGNVDTDGDSLTNAEELTARLNPWVDDLADDPDNDGLINSAERTAGTNPRDDDSDDDGVRDGVDLTPLAGNRVPGLALVFPAEADTGFARFSSPGQEFVLPAIGRSAPLTVEMWVAIQSGNPPLTFFGSASDPRAINLSVDANRFVHLVLRLDGGGASSHVSQNAMTGSGMHHVAVTYDQTTVRMFMDGRLQVQAPLTTALDTTASSLMMAPSASANVTIDELRVWSVARVGADIQSTMHQTLEGTHSNLVAAYGFHTLTGAGNNSTENANHASSATMSWLSPQTAPSVPRAQVPRMDRAITLTGPSEALQFQTFDLDGSVPQLWLRDPPNNGRLIVGSGATVPTTQPISSFFYYVADPGFVGTDEIELYARDSRQAESAPLRVSLATPPGRTWIGASVTDPEAWNDGANWSPGGAPQAGDIVNIPPGPFVVRLSQDATLGGLFVGLGSQLLVDDVGVDESVLTITGHTIVEGAIAGTGEVFVDATNALVRGALPNLRTSGTVTLADSATVTGDLTIVDGALTMGGRYLHVLGELVSSGGLVMTDPGDRVAVDNGVRWLAGASAFGLQTGRMRVRARFEVSGQSTFAVPTSGDHLVELEGPSVSVRMDYAGAQGNAFRHLTVRSDALVLMAPTAALVPPQHIHVTGNLILSGVATPIVASSANIGVGGDLTLSGATSLDVGSVTVRGRITLGQNTALTAEHVAFGSFTDQGGAFETEVLEMSALVSVTGLQAFAQDYTSLVLAGGLTLDGPLTVPGDLTLSGGALDIGDETVVVHGSLSVTGQGRLHMTGDGLLDVRGDLSWRSASSYSSDFVDGTLRVGGDRFEIAPEYSFAYWHPSGEHVVELTGDVVVRMESAGTYGNHFNHLTIRSGLVTFEEPEVVYQVGVWGHVRGDLQVGVTSSAMLDTSDHALWVEGDVTITAQSSWTNTSGRAEITGTVSIATNGELDVDTLVLRRPFSGATPPLMPFAPVPGMSFVNLGVQRPVALGASFEVPGDVEVQALLSVGNYELTIHEDFRLLWGGRVNMTGSGALDVRGDVMWAGGYRDNDLTSGTIRAHGRFDVVGEDVFQPSDDHWVELVGVFSSTISIERAGGGDNAFANLAIRTPRLVIEESAVPSASGERIVVLGDLEVGSALVPAALDASGAPMGVIGDVTIAANSSWVSNDTLEVGGDLTIAPTGVVSTPYLVLRSMSPSVVSGVASSFMVTDVSIAGTVEFEVGTTFVVGNDLVVDGWGTPRLLVSGGTVLVGRDLSIGSNGAAGMTGGLLSVARDVAWACDYYYYQQTGGTLRVGRRLDVTAPNAFIASGDHVVEMVGTGAVSMQDANELGNRFRHLFITSPSMTIEDTGAGSAAPHVYATGDVTVRGTAGTSAQLTVPTGIRLEVEGDLHLEAYGHIVVNGTLVADDCDRHTTATATGNITCP